MQPEHHTERLNGGDLSAARRVRHPLKELVKPLSSSEP
jgi:hypothetical protein